tara:strand:- start:3204 stop:4919 length:1716 start_codon:yes stop_codon:yes gene_type:complete
MNNYFDLSKKLLFIINKKFISVSFLIILFLFGSFLELMSLGIIFPYIKLLIEPETINFSQNFSFLNELSFKQYFLLLTSVLVFLFFFKTVMSVLIKWLTIRFSQQQLKILQVNLMAAYQNMNYIEYTSRNKSEYIRNLREFSIDCLQGIESLLRLISEGIVVISISVYLAFVNFYAFISLSSMVCIVYLLFNIPLKRKLVEFGKLKSDGRKTIYQNITEAFNGFKELRVFSKEIFFRNLIAQGAEKVCKNETKAALISVLPRYIFEILIVFFVIFFISISIFKGSELNLILPTVGVFAVAGLRILPAGSEIMAQISRLNYVTHGVNITFNDLKKYKKNSTTVDVIDSNQNFSSIELKDITFKYPSSKTHIFKNLNLKITKNQFIGIVGESGIGKSTLIDILLGLIQPEEGKIILNGDKELNSIKDWNGKIAYLPQDDLILDHDLKTNISLAYGEKNQDLEKIKDSIIKSNLEKMINNLPNGLNTKIGENGVRLSGGQNKRISLARTFYHNKDIVIMDEATSSLDVDTEKNIVEQIGHLKDKKTIILITHKKSTLKYCDVIYEIKNQVLIKQ